jgi:hypothetical protein
LNAKITVDDIVDILVEKDTSDALDSIKAPEMWASKMKDCLNLYEMIKGAMIIIENRISLKWSFEHTKEIYTHNDLFETDGISLGIGSYDNFRRIKTEKLGLQDKRKYTALEVEALIRIFKKKKPRDLNESDFLKAQAELISLGYRVDYPKKKSKK